MTKSKLLGWFMASMSAFMLLACGGGSSVGSYSLHGVVQKGYLIDGVIKAQKLDSNGTTSGTSVEVSIEKKGAYKLDLGWNGLVLLNAKGHFFNEFTGKNSSDEVELFAIVDTHSQNFSEHVNLNLFTSLEAVRILELLKKGSSYTSALKSTRESMKKELDIGKDIRVTDLDVYDLNGSLSAANKNLLLFSAALLSVQEKKKSKRLAKLYTGSYAPVGRLYSDFEDDGKLGGAFKSDWGAMTGVDPVVVLGIASDYLEIEVVDVVDELPEWISEVLSDLAMDSFDLKLVKIETTSMDYDGEDEVFVGVEGSNTVLKFELTSYALKHTGDYNVNVTARASGQEDLLLKSDVHVVGHSAMIEIVLNNTLKRFLNEAYRNNREVTFRATSDVLRSIAVGYVYKDTEILPVFGTLSSSMEPHTEITNAVYLGNCNPGNGSGNIIPRLTISGEYQGTAITYDRACVDIEYNSANHNFDAILHSGNGSIIEPIAVTIGHNDVLIYANGIDRDNIHVDHIQLKLPTGHSVHEIDSDGAIKASGSSLVTLDNPTDNKISHNQVLNRMVFGGRLTDTYLHGKNLPFYFKVRDYGLDDAGLHFSKTTVHYAFAYANRHKNNTEWFKSPVDKDVDISLVDSGINTGHIEFVAAGIQTHFPSASVDTGSFEVKVMDSMVNTSAVDTADVSIKMGYHSGCRGSGCPQSSAPANIVLEDIEDTTLYPDGTAIAIQTKKIGSVTWGIKGEKELVYTRENDAGAQVYIPGFELPAVSATEIVPYLQGTVNYKNGVLKYYSTREESVKKGRYLFAGINVGSLAIDTAAEDVPEAVSLVATDMRVAIGDSSNTPLILTSDDYSKYYIRPSGVTGVFNRVMKEIPIKVYGYDMLFSQFAFRQVENKVDEFTKIDGLVKVPGKGDFEVAFSSLGLDCRGGLNSGHVVTCDKEADEPKNCGETLTAWNMSTDFTTLAFQGVGSVCSTDKELAVGHILNVAALKDPLGLNTIWTPEGNPKASRVVSSAYNQMDGTSSKKGYDIAFTDNIALKSSTDQDWLQADVGVGLPFWDKADMSIRLVNKSDLSTREPSVVVARGELESRKMNLSNEELVDNISKEYNQTISYTWANLITFGLPMYYKSDVDIAKVPQFLGRTHYGLDLMVMESKAGVDYIDPESTSMSFGASADFEALGNMKLHLDLNDPESIRKVDALLADAGIDGKPLENTIGRVVDGLRIGNKLLDQGITLSIERAVIEVLDAADDAAGNPLRKIANTVSELHTLPYVANERFKSSVKEAISDRLGSVISDVNRTINKINDKGYDTYEKIIADPDIDSTLQGILSSLTLVGQGMEEYKKLQKFIKDLNNTLNQIEELTRYPSDINESISRYIKDDNGVCSWEHSAHHGFMAPIGEATDTVYEVNDVLQNLDMDILKKFAGQIENYTGIDAEDIVSLADEVDGMATSLNDIIKEMNDTVTDQFETQICDNYNLMTSKMFETFDNIKNSGLSSAIVEYKASVSEMLNMLSAALDESGNIGRYAYAIKQASEDIAEVIANLYTPEENYVDGVIRQRIADAIKDIEINDIKIFEDANASNVLLIIQSKLIENINTELDNIIFSKTDDLVTQIQDVIPNLSESDLKRLIATGLIESKPIENINRTLHETLTPIADDVNKVASKLLNGIDRAVNKQLAKVSEKINKSLNEATSSFADAIPIKAARIDGYAIIRGDRLFKAHIGSEFEVKGNDDKSSFSLNAALDMWNSSADGTGGCAGDENSSNFNIQISTRDITMPLGSEELKVDMVLLGITMDEGGSLIGVFGAITSESGFNFDTMKLYNLGLAVGIGTQETYLGAMAAAKLDTVQLGVKFLLGKVCNSEVVDAFVPEPIRNFITLPENGFKGGLVYGEAQVPVWDNGCALRVVARAKIGTWYLINDTGADTFGGLVAGGAFGRALCIASLGGEVEVLAEKSANGVKFQGTGWGAAGVGSCDSSWSSVSDSRSDSWCGTGDARFGALYNNGWELLDIKTSAVH